METAAAEHWPPSHTPAGSSVKTVRSLSEALHNHQPKNMFKYQHEKQLADAHTHTNTPQANTHLYVKHNAERHKHQRTHTPTHMPVQSAVDLLLHICTFSWLLRCDLRLLQGKANIHRLRGRGVWVCECSMNMCCDKIILLVKISVKLKLILSGPKKCLKIEMKGNGKVWAQ